MASRISWSFKSDSTLNGQPNFSNVVTRFLTSSSVPKRLLAASWNSLWFMTSPRPWWTFRFVGSGPEKFDRCTDKFKNRDMKYVVIRLLTCCQVQIFFTFCVEHCQVRRMKFGLGLDFFVNHEKQKLYCIVFFSAGQAKRLKECIRLFPGKPLEKFKKVDMERPQAIPLGKINWALIFLVKVTVQLKTKKLNVQHTLKTSTKKCNNK